MYLKDVLNKCKEMGYPVTASGLYFAGKRFGFLIKKEGIRNLEFNKEKFYEWIDKARQEIPEGWVTLNQLHKDTGISLSKLYTLSKDPDSGAKSFGSGCGVVYVDPERIKEIIRKRENEHKEEW